MGAGEGRLWQKIMFEYRGVSKKGTLMKCKENSKKSITLFLGWCLKQVKGRGRSGLGRLSKEQSFKALFKALVIKGHHKAFWMRLEEELGNRNESAVGLRRGRLFQGRWCLECPDSF